MTDTIKISTRILGYTGLPFETQAEVDEWFNPRTITDAQGRRIVVGPPRMTERMREHYLAEESHNLIVNQGRDQIITYIGTNGAYTSQFGNILCLGNGAISLVGGGDIAVATEYYRQAITTALYTGSTQVDMQTTITGSNGNGTITNIGIFGNGATTTLLSGSMLTHALFSLTKVTGTSVIDYIITLS